MRTLGWMTVAITLVACGGGQTQRTGTGSLTERGREPRAEPMPHQQCIGSGGDVQQVDVNNDSRADVRTVVRNGRPFCRETDANFDGRVDIVRFFDEQGREVRVEDDYDFDGKIDVVQEFANGVIRADVMDTNFDGRTDTWRDYEAGRIAVLRRDRNNDGRVDMWEYYDAGGRMAREAFDNDGDGQPDAAPDAGAPASSGGTAPAPAAAATTTPAATTAADGGNS